MKTIIAPEIESVSAIKRTTQAQIAATKSFPKTAALIRKLSEKIKLLRKQALKNYFKRKKDDAAKEHAAPKKTVGVKKSHSGMVVLSAEIEEKLLDSQSNISDADLLECVDFESDSAVSIETAGEKKKDAAQLKKSTKNPKAALRKKQMSAAMRIRENKKLRKEVKGLLEAKKKLQDKAWALYLKKMAGKKKPAAKPVEKKVAAKPVEKKVAAKPVEKKSAAKPVEKKPAAKPVEKKVSTPGSTQNKDKQSKYQEKMDKRASIEDLEDELDGNVSLLREFSYPKETRQAILERNDTLKALIDARKKSDKPVEKKVAAKTAKN